MDSGGLKGVIFSVHGKLTCNDLSSGGVINKTTCELNGDKETSYYVYILYLTEAELLVVSGYFFIRGTVRNKKEKIRKIIYYRFFSKWYILDKLRHRLQWQLTICNMSPVLGQ